MSSTSNPSNVTSNTKSVQGQVNIQNIQKPKYSWVQYFLWLVAGSEISILKECPSDYNKHAAIGAAILMTTFLAFCSGTYAGYYFSDSIIGAVVFGFIWSLLIFTIDRGMVVTIKKDRDYDSKNLIQKLAPAIPRLVLALLIAFFIAIPLELLIFKENIDLHMVKYKINQTLEIRNKGNNVQGIPELDKVLGFEKNEIDFINNQINRGEPDNTEFLELKEKVNKLQNEATQLSNQWQIKQKEANDAFNQVPRIKKYGSEEMVLNTYSREWDIYQQKLEVAKNLEKQFNLKNQEFINHSALKQKQIKDWLYQKSLEKDSLQKEISSTQTKIKTGIKKVDNTTAQFDSLIQNSKGFVLRYTVLSDLASYYTKSDSVAKTQLTDSNGQAQGNTISSEKAESFNIWLLLWLIRSIFIVIEILPIFTKIFSPFGAYDIGLIMLEEELENNLQDVIINKLENEKQLREIQYQAEQDMMRDKMDLQKQMYNQIIQDVSKAQLLIAQKKIEEYKKKYKIQ